MKQKREYLSSNIPLRDQLTSEVMNAGFVYPFYPKVVTSEHLLQIAEKKVWRDYRAVFAETEINGVTHASTFEGLDFDPDRLRSQSFVLCDSESIDFYMVSADGDSKVLSYRKDKLVDNIPPVVDTAGYRVEASHDAVVGILTIVIAPRSYIEKERYFKLEGEQLELTDFATAHGLETSPNFLIIPAWAYVLEEHRTRFAIPAYRAYRKMLKTLEEKAPKNTVIELAAAGKIEGDDRSLLIELSKGDLGTQFLLADFPYEVSLLGQNSTGSNSSVKLAKGLGLKKRKNVGSYKSLGPVFSKRLR